MAFSFFAEITIDETKCGTSDSTNFPFLFNSTSADYKTVANGGKVENANGFDLVFFADAGLTQPLDFEIEKYDASTGEFIAWVRIPTLSASADTLLYLAYGDPSISSSQENADGTWNSNFKLVLHLNGSLNVNDSSGNGNHFTNSNATATAGQVDGGANFDGSNDKITRSGLTIPQTEGSFSAWWKPNVAATNKRLILRAYNTSPLRLFDIYPFDDGKIYAGWYDDGNESRISWAESGISVGTWYHLFFIWSGAGNSLYINAVNKQSNGETDARWDTSGITSSCAFDEQASAFCNVDLDEIHLHDVARDESWMTSEYNNQSDPSTFYSVVNNFPATGHPLIFVVG